MFKKLFLFIFIALFIVSCNNTYDDASNKTSPNSGWWFSENESFTVYFFVDIDRKTIVPNLIKDRAFHLISDASFIFSSDTDSYKDPNNILINLQTNSFNCKVDNSIVKSYECNFTSETEANLKVECGSGTYNFKMNNIPFVSVNPKSGIWSGMYQNYGAKFFISSDGTQLTDENNVLYFLDETSDTKMFLLLKDNNPYFAYSDCSFNIFNNSVYFTSTEGIITEFKCLFNSYTNCYLKIVLDSIPIYFEMTPE